MTNPKLNAALAWLEGAWQAADNRREAAQAAMVIREQAKEIEQLNGYVEHLVADREKQALAMTGKIERLKAELDQRNAEFREYARKTELEFRRLRPALDRIAHPAAEWMNISEAAAIARDALKAPTPEPSVHPDPSEEAAEIARGFAKLREALLEAGWTPPDPDEHPFATEFRRLMRGLPRPLLPTNDELCAAGLTVIAGDAVRCVVDDDMPADEIEIRGPHGSRRIKFGTDQTAGGADSIVRGAEFVIPPPPKSDGGT